MVQGSSWADGEHITTIWSPGAEVGKTSCSQCSTPWIRMSPATVHLLPFSKQGGQQLALLCALRSQWHWWQVLSPWSGWRSTGVALLDWPASSSWSGRTSVHSRGARSPHHRLYCVLPWPWRSSCLFLAGPPVIVKRAQGSEGGPWQSQLPLPEEIHCA